MHKVASLSFLNHILMESSLKSGICQGVCPGIIRWVCHCGVGYSSPRPNICSKCCGGRGGWHKSCHSTHTGGSIPSTRGLVVGGQGGLSPGGGGAIPPQGCIPSPVAIVAGVGQNPPAMRHQAARFIHPPPLHHRQGVAPPYVVRWCHCGVANSRTASGPPSAPRAGPAPLRLVRHH